jgi:hypothetical protein
VRSANTTRVDLEKQENSKFVPMIGTEVRRSIRLKNLNEGFKPKSCGNMYYFGCASSPLTLSPNVIRNLGTTFSKIACDKLYDAALAMKRKDDIKPHKEYWRKGGGRQESSKNGNFQSKSQCSEKQHQYTRCCPRKEEAKDIGSPQEA